MKTSRKQMESFEELEKLAQDDSDVRPFSKSLRRDWEAAKRTGTKRSPGRPPKDARLKSRIVPISMDPALLAQIDKFARSNGITRSRLVAEGLRLRLKSHAES